MNCNDSSDDGQLKRGKCMSEDSAERSGPRRVRMPGFRVKDEAGLGDALKHVTSTLGIVPCDGCQRRANALNRRFVFYRASSHDVRQ